MRVVLYSLYTCTRTAHCVYSINDDNDPKTRSNIKCMHGNFKNLLRLLFISHKIIYFLHNSEFQVSTAMCAAGRPHFSMHPIFVKVSAKT